jgi:hypothetical protein
MPKDLRKGENHWKSKLDEPKVKAIRTASVYVTNRELAALFGISAAQVGQIRTKKAWKHVA